MNNRTVGKIKNKESEEKKIGATFGILEEFLRVRNKKWMRNNEHESHVELKKQKNVLPARPGK